LTVGSGVPLRPWSLGDAQVVMDAYQDDSIQRWHVQRADSLAEAREWIAGWQGGWAAGRPRLVRTGRRACGLERRAQR
jgi:hypothetical protein